MSRVSQSRNEQSQSGKYLPHIFQIGPAVEPQRVRRAKNRARMTSEFRQSLRDIYHETDFLKEYTDEDCLTDSKTIRTADVVMATRVEISDELTRGYSSRAMKREQVTETITEDRQLTENRPEEDNVIEDTLGDEKVTEETTENAQTIEDTTNSGDEIENAVNTEEITEATLEEEEEEVTEVRDLDDKDEANDVE